MSKKEGDGSGDDGSYEIGYKKPPRAHRFRKGQSGNPKGRKKRSLNRRTILLAALQETVAVQVKGKTKTMSKVELAFHRFIQRAIESGDVRSLKLLDELMSEHQIGNEPTPGAPRQSNVVFMLPHNGRGPVPGPFIQEDPNRPREVWMKDTPMTEEELRQKRLALLKSIVAEAEDNEK